MRTQLDTATIKTHAVKFNKARSNLLAVVVFTTINLFLLALEMNLSFLFSAFVPQVLQGIIHHSSVAMGLIAGLLSMSVYLLCYALSKRWRGFIVVALVLFIIDALLMLGFVLITGTFGDFIFNIVFHAWILYCLVTGTAAWAKLRGLTPHEFDATQQDVAQWVQAEELNSAMQVIAPTPSIGDTAGQYHPNVDDGPYKIDDFTRGCIFASFSPADKLYLFVDIPENKLANAINSYAQAIGDDETTILLYDDTVGGSANEGFILTSKRLYSKNFGMSGNEVYIADINEVHVPQFGIVSSNIVVNSATGGDFEVHVTQRKAQAEAVLGTLHKTIGVLKSQVKMPV